MVGGSRHSLRCGWGRGVRSWRGGEGREGGRKGGREGREGGREEGVTGGKERKGRDGEREGVWNEESWSKRDMRQVSLKS